MLFPPQIKLLFLYASTAALVDKGEDIFEDIGWPPRRFVPLLGLSGGCQIEMLNPAYTVPWMEGWYPQHRLPPLLMYPPTHHRDLEFCTNGS